MLGNERLCWKVPEAAVLLGISKNLAYKLAKKGELPGIIKLGQKRFVISKIQLERFLEGRDQEKPHG